MTLPPPHDSFEPAEPMDPRDLPPGFYFPPGAEPGVPQKRALGPVWMLVAIAVIVLVVIAFAVLLVV